MISNTYSIEVMEMINVLREAAQKEILPRWGKVIAEQKGDQKKFIDIVTEADKKASEYILNKIRKKFPGSYSEENKFLDRFDHHLIWQIDPIDGTQEFCMSFADGYACHAALLKKQDDLNFLPVAGIVYLPGVDKLWYTDGSGIITYSVKGKELPLPSLSKEQLIGYIRKVDQNESLKRFYRTLGNILGLHSRILPCGAAGASISDLLENKINLIILNYNYSKEWDLAMAEPIIRARDGFICDLKGNNFTYNRKDSPGKNEPYNLNGYVISIVFKKEEIIPYIPKDLLEDRF
ncbi:MAG: inositol monophosphatase family protein [Candidatus Woesearchaeota archaeon]